MEYFVRPGICGRFAGLIGFPMSVAMGYFQHNGGSELAWFDTVLGFLREKYHIPLDTFLQSIFEDADLQLIRQ